jgi:AcrR family transcriptional regulator
MSQKSIAARPYRGLSQEERRTERRHRLIAAAIDVYGERGYRQTSVKAVCDAAGLTERYFYESFGNSEELLIACYNAVTYGLFKEIANVAKAVDGDRFSRSRAMLHAYFTALRREPRSARVFLVEIRGVSQAVDDSFNAALHGIAQQVRQIFTPDRVQTNELLVLGIIGGISQIALHWTQQNYRPSIDDVIEASMQLGSALLAND